MRRYRRDRQSGGPVRARRRGAGFGASFKGRRLGTLGLPPRPAFPAKPLGCYGDGGAIFTDDAELAETLRSLRVHGEGTDK